MDNYEEASGAGVKLLRPLEKNESDSRIADRTMFDMPALRPAAADAIASIPGTAILPSVANESSATSVWDTCWDWALEDKAYPG